MWFLSQKWRAYYHYYGALQRLASLVFKFKLRFHDINNVFFLFDLSVEFIVILIIWLFKFFCIKLVTDQGTINSTFIFVKLCIVVSTLTITKLQYVHSFSNNPFLLNKSGLSEIIWVSAYDVAPVMFLVIYDTLISSIIYLVIGYLLYILMGKKIVYWYFFKIHVISYLGWYLSPLVFYYSSNKNYSGIPSCL